MLIESTNDFSAAFAKPILMAFTCILPEATHSRQEPSSAIACARIGLSVVHFDIYQRYMQLRAFICSRHVLNVYQLLCLASCLVCDSLPSKVG